jgi:lipopolysaccharide transport system ATP-binding protein
MREIAVKVEGLSKQYRIGAQQVGYKTLRDTLAGAASAPLRAFRRAQWFSRGQRKGDSPNRIWALKDVSFEVRRGEVLGLIGSNGAGKSTLLKVLSRITDPTEGHADVHGRVGSLLEVGSGFHQELTGRENIFLNGAILGMRRAEIESKFDEIAAFAEVEKFLDTPVKRYSSGMYLRLAFAVAAHLEPEILLVDEVLAVGDMAFQKKCMGKMGEIAAEGRTVLFVSHNLGAIKELCHTSLVLKQGRIAFQGSVVEGIAHYSQSALEERSDLAITGTSWRGVSINNHRGGFHMSVETGEPFSAEALLDCHDDFAGGRFFCIINNAMGDLVIHQRVESEDILPGGFASGRCRIRVELPALWLAPGVYTLYFKLIGSNLLGQEERHVSERVVLDVSGAVSDIGRAHLAPPLQWSLVAEAEPNEQPLAGCVSEY